MLESALPGSSWIEAKDEAELRTTVEQGTASAGLLVEDLEHYTYYVFNSSLFDSTEATFTSLLQSLHEMQWLEAHQITVERCVGGYTVESVFCCPGFLRLIPGWNVSRLNSAPLGPNYLSLVGQPAFS